MEISFEKKLEEFKEMLDQLSSDKLLEVRKLLDEYAEKSEPSFAKQKSLRDLLSNGPTLSKGELGKIQKERRIHNKTVLTSHF